MQRSPVVREAHPVESPCRRVKIPQTKKARHTPGKMKKESSPNGYMPSQFGSAREIDGT